MRIVLSAVLGLAWLAGTSATPNRSPERATASRAAVDTSLASKLVGKWAATRYDEGSGSSHRFTMDWKKDSTGTLAAKVSPSGGGSPYDASVVWSSDTGFVAESAPHTSSQLNERVVTRMVSHVKGDSLWGTFELRPTSYAGRSMTGHFSATRQK